MTCRFSTSHALKMLAILLLTCAMVGLGVPAHAEAKGTTRVLFVGNSMTWRASVSVTSMLDAIARANGKRLEVDWVTFRGAYLSNYAYAGTGEYKERKTAFDKKLSSGTWDYIVLQGHSTEGGKNPEIRMYSSIRTLRDRIAKRQPQAEILLYATHGYRLPIGSSKADEKTSGSEMQLRTQSACAVIGKKLGIRVVNAGMYFQRYLIGNSAPRLLISHDKHPTKAGYYLLACAFYDALYGKRPSKPVSDLEGVSKATQLRLMKAVGPSVSIEPAYLTVPIGQSVRIRCKTGGHAYTCKSLDPDIARVSANGTVRGLKEGRTVVWIQTRSGLRATCEVSVEGDGLREKKLEFKKSSIMVTAGKQFFPALKVSETLSDYSLRWTSSNPKVASVEQTGRITAHHSGKTVLTVNDRLSGSTAKLVIRVQSSQKASLTLSSR